MIRYPRLLTFASVAVLPIVLALSADARPIATGSAAPVAGSSAAGDDAALLAAAAARHGLDESNLRVLTRGRTVLPLTRVRLARAKVSDASTGRVYGISVDGAGKVADYAAARRAESAAYRARFGTMTTDLVRELGEVRPSAGVPVAFWLKSDHNSVVTREGITRKVTKEQVGALEAENLDRLADAVRAGNRGFAASLRTAGHRVVSRARYSPVVFAVVSAQAVERFARDPRVQTTYYAGTRATELQDVVKTTTAANKVWARGISGADPASPAGTTNVGVVECCDSLFEENKADLDAENNYYLARINEGRSAECPGDHSHPTAVSGAVASTHPQYTGTAPDASIYFNSSCNGSESELVTAVNDVAAQISGAMNHSYGATPSAPCPGVTEMGVLQRTLDDLVRGGGDSQYVAAGNSGNAACVGTPATAWNIVSVGAFHDRNTLSWSGDVMAGFSSGADPASDSGDRQEPDMAAPGVSFTGLLPSPGGRPVGNIGSGTSYATPAVVGGAALMQQRRSFLLAWPETEKAVMLAAACHNIAGGQVTAGSELDGAGAPDFLEADNLLATDRFRGDVIANGTGVAITQSFPGVAVGQELRVALAWDTSTNYSRYATQPSMDLDLRLVRPNGRIAASSASFDNTNEVIEFVADRAGTWTIRVVRFRTSDPNGSTFAGLAWHRYAPSACRAP